MGRTLRERFSGCSLFAGDECRFEPSVFGRREFWRWIRYQHRVDSEKGAVMKLRVAAIAIAVAGLMWAAPTAFASSTGPIGPGTWTADTPAHDVQLCVGGTVSGTTFSLPGGNAPMSACDNNEPRAEFRYKTYAGGDSDGNYSTGIRQFGGTFTITSMAGSRIALKQTFNGDNGPYFIMAVENTGRIYSEPFSPCGDLVVL
jgi:hypothetical protein